MNDPKRILIVVLGYTLLVLMCLGIKGHMDGDGYKTQVAYTTAVQASDKAHFNYAVDTQQGNLLAHGVFTTSKQRLVKYPEMPKAYTYVDRTKEHYTMHTYTTCSGKPTVCTTHVYYSWDTVGENEQYAKSVGFFGRQYDPHSFGLHNFTQSTNDYYIDSLDRYVYEVVPQTFAATFLASSMGGGLHPVREGRITLQDKSIPQTLKDVGKYHIVSFWVCLTLTVFLLIGAAVGAYYWVMADGIWSTKE